MADLSHAEESRAGWARFVALWSRIGLLSFGGPAGQIALMQDEVVTRRGWVSEDAFRRGLDVAMLLPGPEAQQLATWLGWRSHGLKGALIAGLAFILPGAVLITALAWLATSGAENPVISALFYGVQAAIIVVVVRATVTLAKRAATGSMHWAVAVLAFAALTFAGVPFPLVILVAGLVGLFALPRPEMPAGLPALAAGGVRRSVMTLLTGAVLLALGVGLAIALGGGALLEVAELFITAALVSFGGAYALLPFVAENAVETYGWLTTEQMINGLALGEATPGPLILVNLYAGFHAGLPGGTGSAVIAAALTCWFTFVPSFTLILAAAPHVEALGRIAWARAALAGVSAAVVGVIAYLAVYFGQAALLPDGFTGPEWPKIVLTLLFAALAFRRGLSVIALVLAGGGAGLALWLAGLI
ncbi:MAG: chromate efflux transporter [Rubricella sp.]